MAYNAKDVQACLSTYAPDAEQYTLHGERLARGHDELKARILARFEEPDLTPSCSAARRSPTWSSMQKRSRGTFSRAGERSRCCASMK
jgi:hypothetical protein